MKVEMVMPQMGESIAEGTILKWLKKKGDPVEKDENILEISTDKVDSEIPAPASGKLVALLAEEGETVPVGNVIAQIETDGAGDGEEAEPSKEEEEAAAPEEAEAAVKEAPPKKERKKEREEEPRKEPPRDKEPAPASGQDEAAPARDEKGRFYSPLVRSMARAEGIPISELAGIEGTGRGGRVTKDDLLGYIESRARRPAREAGAAPPPQAPAGPERQIAFAGAPVEAEEVRTTADGKIEVVPMDHIRRKIADHMVRSKATSPHVASIGEAEMTRIVRHRQANKEEFQRREGFKLTYTPYIAQATVRALKEFPYVNSSIEESKILIKRFVNLGIAVAVDYGLIVPVIRQADALSFVGLARAIHDLAARARSKELKPEEVTGGTFSITNMGTIGTLYGIPIIAQPQVGILGVGTIAKRPVVRDDAIAIREMMFLCLSYDHRIIDGAMGGSFAQRVVLHLETMELD